MDSSDCFEHFGYQDFDASCIQLQYPAICPIAGCSTSLIGVQDGRGERPFCPAHGIRLHSNTFVYWNGANRKSEARLRNFRIRPDLARSIALGSVEKAESHRLGYEMSEDALSWNVFVSLAEAGKLRQTALFLTAREVRAEPELYLWGELVDVTGAKRSRFGPLDTVRARLEHDVRKFKTEPDVMLVVEGQLVICIEAKFSSGNPLAYEGAVDAGQKPSDRAGLLYRYFDRSGTETQRSIDRDGMVGALHSQLFRNVAFASEMANGREWHVVNLVSATQWRFRKDSGRYSFTDPESAVQSYLRQDHKQSFTFRTWEGLHKSVIHGVPELAKLDAYLLSKSARYRPAFELNNEFPITTAAEDRYNP